MSNFIFDVEKEHNRSQGLIGSSRFALEKMGLAKLFTFIVALTFAVVLVYPMFGSLGFKAGILVIVGIVAVPVVFIGVFNLPLGVLITLILSFFILGIKRILGDIPLGTLMDGMISLMLAGLFLKLVARGSLKFGTTPISIMLLVWLFFNLLQAFNPYADSQLAWVYTVRSMAFFIIMYFIINEAVQTVNMVRWLIGTWIFLAFLGGLYGWKQELFGFTVSEMNWINQDEERFGLLFQHGRFRKFSFFSDPMVFGFVMAYTSALCLTLIVGPFNRFVKILLGAIAFILIGGMIHSSTRSAFVLIPVGFIFFTLITFNKTIILSAIVFFFLGTIVVLMPSVSSTHFRIQSAFRPTTDDSYQVRAKNQKMIQPFIQSHPIGGGLGSVGVWGIKFSPDSFLAKFPPDSGYMRIVVETGWIGLFLYLILLGTSICVGIRNYFYMKNPELKAYLLAILVTYYVLIFANFPQEAIIQLPTNVIFFIILSFMTKLKELDDKLSLTKDVAI